MKLWLLSSLLFRSTPRLSPRRASSVQAARNKYDIKNTSVDFDLKARNVKKEDFSPLDSEERFRFIHLTEWGFSPTSSKDYQIYLYLYNPNLLEIEDTIEVSLGFPRHDEVLPSCEKNQTFSAKVLSMSDDHRFLKVGFDDNKSIYNLIDKNSRRYLIASRVTVKKGTSLRLSSILGKVISYTGFPATNKNPSTLSCQVDESKVVHSDCYAFTSDFGHIDHEVYESFTVKLDESARSTLNLNNCLFSIPKDLTLEADLEAVHFDYYKYRTNWILTTSTSQIFDKSRDWRFHNSLFTGKDGHKRWDFDWDYSTDRAKNHPDRPDEGYKWFAFYDNENSVDSLFHYRYYNNTADPDFKRQASRVDNPHWVLWKDGNNLWESIISSDERLSYRKDYEESFPYDKEKREHLSLPRRAGHLSSDLFKVPSYSKDQRFSKYGHVEDHISKDDFLSATAPDAIRSRLKEGGELYLLEPRSLDLFSLPWGSSVPTYDYYKALFQASNPETYSFVFDENHKTPLLSPYTPEDIVLKKSYSHYQAKRGQWINSHPNSSLYRLTFDRTLANSYSTEEGSHGQHSDLWNHTRSALSQTDAIFDFKFIDFKFRDKTSGKTYFLPASNDPFNLISDIKTPKAPPASKFRWIWILVLSIIALVGLVVLSIIFPPVLFVIKTAFKALITLLDVLVVKPLLFLIKKTPLILKGAGLRIYWILIWWWVSLIRKIKGKPPLPWILRKH